MLNSTPAMKRFLRHPILLAFAAWLSVLFMAAGAFSQEAVSTKQPSLDSVRLDFHAELRETAKPLTELQKKVGEAGDLDAALEVKTELESFRSTLTPEPKVSVELRQSQKIYRDTLSRRRGEFQRNVKPVLSGYRGQLAELEGRLTSDGSLEEAVKVRDERARIEGLLATDLARAEVDLGVLDESNDPAKEFPKNQYYRMTYSNDKLGSEKGYKIICRFVKLPLNDFAGDKLKITFAANNAKDCETSNEVFVLNEATGDELAKVKGVRRGEEKQLILAIPPVASLELAIVVRGEDALHLKPFSNGVPDVYLSIEK